MKSLLACAVLVGCGDSPAPPAPPAPVINSFGPSTGLWGTAVTIDGQNFGVTQGTSVVAFDGSVGANGFVIDTWHEAEIRGRVAFPATGAISVTTSAGTTEAGTFTTMTPWAPSAAVDAQQLVDGAVLSSGDVASLFHTYELTNQAVLAVFGSGSVATYPIDGLVDPQDASAPIAGRLVEADDHSPLVVATKQDGTVSTFGVVNNALVATATGLTGEVLATARDATGLYAWIDTAAGVVRARPGATWTIDRGPFVSADPALDAAIAPDGTLWVAVSEPDTGTNAFLSLESLGPAATAFDPLERTDPTSHATPMAAHVVVAADGVHALVLASTGSTALTPRERTAASTWSDAPAITGLVQYAFIGSTLAALTNDALMKTTSLVPDVSAPATTEVIPVWPMQSSGLVVDAGGKPHPLITNGTVTYALTPPP